MAWQERDRFSGFDYQGSASAGLGYRLMDSEHTKLQLEAGPGYSRERETATQAVIEDRIGRFALNYSWLIREGIEFTEIATAEKGDKNGIYTSETGFKSQINGSIATKLTYKIKSVDEVPVGKETHRQRVWRNFSFKFLRRVGAAWAELSILCHFLPLFACRCCHFCHCSALLCAFTKALNCSRACFCCAMVIGHCALGVSCCTAVKKPFEWCHAQILCDFFGLLQLDQTAVFKHGLLGNFCCAGCRVYEFPATFVLAAPNSAVVFRVAIGLLRF